MYEGHIYPDVDIVSDLPYNDYDTALTYIQRFVEVAGQNFSAPFWLGEFGTWYDYENWHKMLRFIREHDTDWAIWALGSYQLSNDNTFHNVIRNLNFSALFFSKSSKYSIF